MVSTLDEVAKGFLVRWLQPEMPLTVDDQKAWFAPYPGGSVWVTWKTARQPLRQLWPQYGAIAILTLSLW